MVRVISTKDIDDNYLDRKLDGVVYDRELTEPTKHLLHSLEVTHKPIPHVPVKKLTGGIDCDINP